MSDLRIDVADLLTHPGARRSLRRAADVDGLATAVAQVEGPVDLDLVLERVSDGIVVRGNVRARFRAECSVCLRDIGGDVAVGVDELFESQPVEGETYPLLAHHIDLDQLVRDALLLELPLAPSCASVGDEPCHPPAEGVEDDAEDAPVDPRWAALSELDL
jgi:uncharacterized protein